MRRYDLGSISVRPSSAASASTADWAAAGRARSSERFDLGKVAQTLGPVERDFERVPCSVHEKRSPRLANRRNRAEPQELEQVEQLRGSVLHHRQSGSRSPCGSWWGPACAVLYR